MRKLKLLLYAGTMASALGGAAFAVEAPPSDGSTPTGPIQSPTGVGMVTTPSGFQEVGSSYTGGEGQQYSPLTSAYNASPFSTPAAGTAILRVDLQTVMMGEGTWWTGMNGSGASGNTAVLNGVTTSAAGNKQAPYAIIGYVRLDMGIDGMSKSGIRYGAFTEIRENTLNPNSAVGTAGASVSGTGSGFANSSASSSGTSSLNGQQTLYVRQAWAYIGTDTTGLVRLGQGFSANSLLEIGLNDEFDTGGWVGMQSGGLSPSATGPTWPWADGGNEYQAARIAYLSPVLAGFDGVVSFAPNNAPATSAGDTCSSVFTGCVSQSTSNAAGDLGRYRNEFEVGLRYRNAWGPIGLAASGIYTVSAPTNPGPSAPLGAAGTPAGATNALRYNGFNFGVIGAEVTINKYLAIGANTMFGAFNGSWGLQNKAPYCLSATACQGSQTTAIAWVAGARFTIPQLPSTIGGSFFDYKYQGQPGLPTQRTSAGLDLGATYGIGPGAVLIAEYLWGYNYQGDYNFLSNQSGTVTATNRADLNNKVSEQILEAGIALRF
ncbi:MAG TPA: hypothetical protein VK741_12125 [Acetobacteraceae bacterium]|jgi:hypothetical protein|nr:hypothetical protein [Acetobacteraceae bacterium]